MTPIDTNVFIQRYLRAFSIAMFAIPTVGAGLEIFFGVYSLQEILRAVASYTIFYILAVFLLGIYGLFRILRSYTTQLQLALATNDQAECERLAQNLSRLNLYSLLYILIYTQGGPSSVNYLILSEGLRPFNLQQQLLSYVTTLPAVLMILFPIFFYLNDLLGSYLAPRGVVINAMPIRTKVLVSGMGIPLLIDMMLILYFEDRTGYLHMETLLLWGGLFFIAAAGAYLSYRSFRNSLEPLQKPLAIHDLDALTRSTIVPQSLDEMGLLAQGWQRLLQDYHRHQQSLHAERNFSNTILNNANALMVVLDNQGRIVEFNKACERVTQYQRAEVLGQYVWDFFIVPEEIEAVQQVFQDLSRAQLNNSHINYWRIRGDGRRLISWSNSSLADERGEVQNVISVGIDITEQKQIEEELRTSQDTLAKAQAIAHIGHWDWNIQTNDLAWSDEIFRIFGLSPQQFAATYPAFLECIHPEDRDAVTAAVGASVEDPDTPYSIEHRVVRPDGSQRIVHERGVIYRDPHGTPLRMVGTVHDITERKQAEEEILALNSELEQRVKERTIELQQANLSLQHSYEQLQQAQRQMVESEKMAALGGLVAGVAHEINTPIGIGVTAASHLQMKLQEYQRLYKQDALTRKDFEQLLNAADESSQILLSNLRRAAEMIKSFKQVAVDQSSEQSRRFDLCEYLHEIRNSLHPQLNRGDYQLLIHCPEHFEINSHPGAISQIITNLVLNSLLHGFEERVQGEMSIDIHREEQEIVMDYRDNGRGIEANVINKVFEPFYTTQRGKGGSGLGLHILYNIITKTLGGTVTLNSVPAAGVHFHIRFPELGA